MKIRSILATTLTVFFLSVPAMAQDSLHAIIQTREDGWAAAFNSRDTATLRSYYAADTVMVAPGSEPVKGPDAIMEVLAGLFGVLNDLRLEAIDVRPLGDRHALEIGHLTYHQTGADGQRIDGSDNYVVVWQKGEDGVWRYVTDIFNNR